MARIPEQSITIRNHKIILSDEDADGKFDTIIDERRPVYKTDKNGNKFLDIHYLRSTHRSQEFEKMNLSIDKTGLLKSREYDLKHGAFYFKTVSWNTDSFEVDFVASAVKNLTPLYYSNCKTEYSPPPEHSSLFEPER